MGHIGAVESACADAATQSHGVADIDLAVARGVGAHSHRGQQSRRAAVSRRGVAIVSLADRRDAGDLDCLGFDDAVDTADAVTAGQLVVAGVGTAQAQTRQGVALAGARVFVIKTTASGADIDRIAGDQARARHGVAAVISHLTQTDVEVVEAGGGVVHLAHTRVHIDSDLARRDAASHAQRAGVQRIVSAHRAFVAGDRRH